jgi:predicted TIM-barrel fold metal-dependent hydrolase
MQRHLDEIDRSGLPADSKEAILGKNAQALLGQQFN